MGDMSLKPEYLINQCKGRSTGFGQTVRVSNHMWAELARNLEELVDENATLRKRVEEITDERDECLDLATRNRVAWADVATENATLRKRVEELEKALNWESEPCGQEQLPSGYAFYDEEPRSDLELKHRIAELEGMVTVRVGVKLKAERDRYRHALEAVIKKERVVGYTYREKMEDMVKIAESALKEGGSDVY